MKDVNGCTHLLRRGARYYYRQKVPKDLIAVLGKREIKRSLGTSDPKEARKLVLIEAVKVEQMLDEARCHSEQGVGNSEMTLDRLERVKKLARDETLAELRQGLSLDPLWPHRKIEAGNHPETNEPLHESELNISLGHIADEWMEVGNGHRSVYADDKIDSLLKKSSICLPESDKNQEALRSAIACAVLDGIQNFKSEMDEANRPLPSTGNEQEARATTSETLTSIFDRWCDERQPPIKTRSEFGTSVKLFIKVNGDLAVSSITKQHVREFKEGLLARPGRSERLAPGTINKHLGALSSVLNWAIKNGYREDPNNPASGMKVKDPQPDKDKRYPFDEDELRAIFSSPVFVQGERPVGGSGEAAYWLPVLALYTGARLGELGQLTVSDVKEEKGITFIDINTIGEGKRLKSQSSKRKVPLHSEVMRLGFRKFVAERGTARNLLFGDLRQDKKGVLTGNWSKWWGRYLSKTIGIEDKKKVFHSFRHTFKDACRKADISNEVHDALTGHAGPNVGATYGGEFPLEVLGNVVKRLSYKGLSIPIWREF